MARKPERHEDIRPFRFQVNFDGDPDKPIHAALYAYDAAGQLLGRGTVRRTARRPWNSRPGR